MLLLMKLLWYRVLEPEAVRYIPYVLCSIQFALNVLPCVFWVSIAQSEFVILLFLMLWAETVGGDGIIIRMPYEVSVTVL